MIKTVKELIIKIKQEIKLCNSVLSLSTLEDLINKYENELAEKDRKIDLLLTANKQITYSTKSREYNQQKLYKEDFKISEFCINCGAGLFYTEYYQKIKKGRKINLSTKKCSYCGWDRIIKLKDNSLYDKLPSKDVK